MLTPIPSPVYARPPIVEAVIEIRVPVPISVDKMEKIARRLNKRYDTRSEFNNVEVNLDTTGGKISVQQQTVGGMRLAAFDQSAIAIINTVSLRSASLPPYPGWENFRDMARDNWNDWKHEIPSQKIERVGVRFINRIDIPITDDKHIQLENYFAAYPSVDIFQQPLTAFTLQVGFKTCLPNWLTTLTVAPMEPSPVPSHASIMLDIDVYRTADLPTAQDDLWTAIDEARIVKNDLFERSLTERSKELFKA